MKLYKRSIAAYLVKRFETEGICSIPPFQACYANARTILIRPKIR